MTHSHLSTLTLFPILLGSALAQAPVVLEPAPNTAGVQPVGSWRPSSHQVPGPGLGSGSCREWLIRAGHGMAGPEGGVLAPLAFISPASLGGQGRIAFHSEILGLARNQGILLADGQTVRAVALGCGGGGGSGLPGGGCGDPAPLGGTFSGFFGGSSFTPATNEAGDVLFLADVDGGAAPRALFLHRAAQNSIEVIAAVGGAAPGGGTLSAVGPGTLGPAGEVVLLATGTGPNDHRILLHSGGGLTEIARVGGPAPGGGIFTQLGGQSVTFVDGTSVPIGPVPDIDGEGRIAFRAVSTATRGLVLHENGSQQWIVRAGDTTPGGGTFVDFRAPCLGTAGEIAFFADHQGPSGPSSGWFAGTGGGLREVLSFYQPVGGGQCWGLAVSVNPMQALGASGEVLLWTRVRFQDGSEQEKLVLGLPDGSLDVLASQGDPLPEGGTLGTLGAWPSIDGAGRATLSAAAPGNLWLNAHRVLVPCGLPTAYCEGKESSQSCIPSIRSEGRASLTSGQPFVILGEHVLTQQPGLLFYGLGPAEVPFQAGLRCVGLPVLRTPPTSAGGSPPLSCDGSYSFDFQAWIASGIDPALVAGVTVYAQWWSRDPLDPSGFGTGLTDALRFTIAP